MSYYCMFGSVDDATRISFIKDCEECAPYVEMFEKKYGVKKIYTRVTYENEEPEPLFVFEFDDGIDPYTIEGIIASLLE